MTQREKTTFDTNKCQTQRTGATEVFYCLSEKQYLICGYSLPFGYSYLCKHPQKNAFAEDHPRDKLFNRDDYGIENNHTS